MFNIGFGELAVICIVLIIAVGPERLPSMMKSLGKTIRTLRQASRDIRASTGIDELMREDFDLYAPIKNPPRRPAPLPAPVPEPAALPATAEGTVPTTPAANVETEPQTVSREDTLEPETREDRPSVVVAPPPQAIGLPSDEPAPVPVAPPPAALPSAEPAAASGNGAAVASNVETLPRAPIVQTAPPAPAAAPDPQPEAANTDGESKRSGV